MYMYSIVVGTLNQYCYHTACPILKNRSYQFKSINQNLHHHESQDNNSFTNKPVNQRPFKYVDMYMYSCMHCYIKPVYQTCLSLSKASVLAMAAIPLLNLSTAFSSSSSSTKEGLAGILGGGSIPSLFGMPLTTSNITPQLVRQSYETNHTHLILLRKSINQLFFLFPYPNRDLNPRPHAQQTMDSNHKATTTSLQLLLNNYPHLYLTPITTMQHYSTAGMIQSYETNHTHWIKFSDLHYTTITYKSSFTEN